MKRTLIVLIAVILLLVVISLNSSKLNSSPTSEQQGKIEPLEDQKIVNIEKTETTQIQEENSETNTCPNQNFNEENLQKTENQQNEQPSQNSEELTTVNYEGNTIPPDARIYYPTSSEAPYAYIPTNTPKGLNMPIAPPEQES